MTRQEIRQELCGTAFCNHNRMKTIVGKIFDYIDAENEPEEKPKAKAKAKAAVKAGSK